jgi:hypothetical protein
MAKDKRDKLILILVVVIAALLIVLAVVFLIQPLVNGMVTGMVTQGQGQGYNYAVQQLYTLAAQCQKVPVTFQNKTINVIAIECLQKQAVPSS